MMNSVIYLSDVGAVVSLISIVTLLLLPAKPETYKTGAISVVVCYVVWELVLVILYIASK